MSFGVKTTTVRTERGRVENLADIIGGSEYGRNIPDVRGTARVSGNLIWAARPIEHTKTTTTTQSAGKGGGGGKTKTVETTYWYTCSFAVSLCRGPVFGVSKIWLGGELAYDLTDTASASSVSASNALLASSLSIYTGTETQGQDATIAAVIGAANTPAYRGQAYLVFRDLDLTPHSNRLPLVTAEVCENGQLFGGNQITRLPRTVASIVSELCQQGGIAAGDIDTSLVTAEAYGIIAAGGTLRDVLQVLIDAYGLRVSPSGRRLQFRPAALGTVDAVFGEQDLGQAEPGEIGTRVQVARTRDHALPRRVQVTYLDIDRAGEKNVQSRQRMAAGISANDEQLDLPIMLSAAQAAQIAETRLYRAWAGRDEYTLPTRPRWLKLDPGDVIQVPDGGITHQISLGRIDYGYDGRIALTGRAYEPATGSSAAVGAGGGGSIPSIPVPGATTLHLMDLPALADAYADAGFWAAASGAAPGWQQAVLYVSRDGGASYQELAALPTFSVIGTTVAALPDPPATGATLWDTASTVDVDIARGALESVSDALVLAGANGFLIGNELVQAANATLIEPGRYRLSRLARGRRGTEAAMTGHAAGERVVLVSTAAWVPIATAEINAVRLYKCVPVGQAIADAPAVSFICTGESLRPFAPVQASAARASGDLTATWIRRSRIGQELPSGADIPLGEAAERYDVEVLSGAGDVLRTFFGLTAPSVLYTAAQQTTDFGSVQASVRLRIYQLSDVVGRGHALDVIL